MDVQAMIDRGVPAAPSPDEVGDDQVPVAIWHDGDFAAVLVIGRDEHADEECSGWAQDIYLFERRAGVWEMDGGGGSCWPAAYGERRERSSPQRTGFAFGRPGSSGDQWLVTCMAPVGVTDVTVHASGRWQEPSVEPTTGAFLVEADEPDPVLRFD